MLASPPPPAMLARMTNRLYYGDNLDVLREHIADASIEAVDDAWMWGETSKSALLDIDSGTSTKLQVMTRAMHDRSAIHR